MFIKTICIAFLSIFAGIYSYNQYIYKLIKISVLEELIKSREESISFTNEEIQKRDAEMLRKGKNFLYYKILPQVFIPIL